MRTTLNTIYSRVNTNLAKITSDMAKINNQISSGLQMSKISDNPVNLVSALRFRSSIVEMDQYTENIQHGSTMITFAEDAMSQMKDLALRAKTLAIQASNATSTTINREAIAEEIKNIFEQAVDLANTQISGKYIFGGFRTQGYTAAEPAPFIIDKGDGHWVNGTAPGQLSEALPSSLSATPLPAGYQIAADQLQINGIAVPASVAGSDLGLYAAASAAAKQTAINSIQDQTGVSASVVPARVAAAAPVTAGTIASGDLSINGVDIFTAGTDITDNDTDNLLLTGINAKTDLTGVKATRGQDGRIQLTAIDGRNIHVVTTAAGEEITHLTDTPAVGGEQVTFGSLQLRSDRKFILAATDRTDPTEPALAALGLAGGTAEPDDLAGDGIINVFSIHEQTGSVRYAGDRINDLAIKIGKTSTMTVGNNGQTGIMDTSIFTTLKALEDALRGNNFTTVTGIHAASNTTAVLNSNGTGLEPKPGTSSAALFSSGSFTVTVTDHDYSPPRAVPITIAVDPAVDTLDSVTQRINGIANISASWGSDGKLTLSTSDAARYTLALSDDSSNFLEATGVSPEFMQNHGIQQAMTNLDHVMDKLTRLVSNFGAKANRIEIQSQIYSTMTLATQENLSEVQDTDMVKAILELKAKETAYEAALAAAAKTMQLSLVDYLS